MKPTQSNPNNMFLSCQVGHRKYRELLRKNINKLITKLQFYNHELLFSLHAKLIMDFM